MLTREENELLTQVRAGTPMGELLRRYWHPIAAIQELTDAQPTKFVRILGEDLVLYKDKSGNVGLIQDHCAHRGASLLYGRVEERGISCAYHGWLYDTAGNCLECPAEPAGSMFHLTVKMRAYPVQRLVGLYWAYLGPLPAPVIPRFDVWVRPDYKRWLVLGPQLDCNWFQAIENAVDPYHSAILHQDANHREPLPNTTRGVVDTIDHIECFVTSYGIMKRHYYKEGWTRQHPFIFPNTLALEHVTQVNVPTDETHMARYRICFGPRGENDAEDGAELPLTFHAPHKVPGDAVHPFARFDLHAEVESQDYIAWETQGPIADRTVERLATSDRWIVQQREMFFENIAKVERGEDPFGVLRDPDHAPIATDMYSERSDRFESIRA
jgi:5,5'-dehydrodivanillate O-demethylase